MSCLEKLLKDMMSLRLLRELDHPVEKLLKPSQSQTVVNADRCRLQKTKANQ
jgi:hypothetical protein